MDIALAPNSDYAIFKIRFPVLGRSHKTALSHGPHISIIERVHSSSIHAFFYSFVPRFPASLIPNVSRPCTSTRKKKTFLYIICCLSRQVHKEGYKERRRGDNTETGFSMVTT
ncbi:uncharacterized protein CTRU02_207543 [Colletotrichum truncatum]|uniref:Uncharacterized protein n=1 Tax=Colletotrichum truncatum TaxID=5467 RepID=A0ACC3Z144_COLTU